MLLCSGGICLAAQHPDRHYAADPAGLLYQRSPFAHGYIHGYEDGFHVADQDYQLGRGARPIEICREYKDASAGYHSNFGEKRAFRKGYREGFSAGYTDSINNRSFRAVFAARNAAGGLTPPITGMKSGFDPGFESGYSAARGGEAGWCQANAAQDFCDGYARGFRFATLAREPVVAKGLAPAGFETASRQLPKK